MSPANPQLSIQTNRLDLRVNPYDAINYEKELDMFSSSGSETDVDLTPIQAPPKVRFDEAKIAEDFRLLHNNRGLQFLLQRKMENESEKKVKKKKKIMTLFKKNEGEFEIFGSAEKDPKEVKAVVTKPEKDNGFKPKLFSIVESSFEYEEMDEGYFRDDDYSMIIDFDSENDDFYADEPAEQPPQGPAESAVNKVIQEYHDTKTSLIIGTYIPQSRHGLPTPPPEPSALEESLEVALMEKEHEKEKKKNNYQVEEIINNTPKRKPTVLFDFNPELNTTVLKIPKRKIHGYKNLALYKLSHTKHSVNYRNRNELINIIQADKKFNPYNMKNLWNNRVSLERAALYWKQVSTTSSYQANTREFIKLCSSLKVRGLERSRLFATQVSLFQPNNLKIPSFINLEGIEGWNYAKNENQPHGELPLRMCGQQGNFFEPLVIRFKVDLSGHRVNVEGLCPYCNIDEDERCDLDLVSERFFGMRSHAYESHLARFHGVYGSGMELKLPGYVRCRDSEGKNIKDIRLLCMECHRIHDIGSPDAIDSKDCLLEYFAHCLKRHYHKRIEGSKYTAQVNQ